MNVMLAAVSKSLNFIGTFTTITTPFLLTTLNKCLGTELTFTELTFSEGLYFLNEFSRVKQSLSA